MYVVKGLFDFSGGDIGYEDEPTHVVAEVAKVHLGEENEKTSQVYMTSEMGYRNYCENCNHLLMIQATGSEFVPLRIFCGTEKCVK